MKTLRLMLRVSVSEGIRMVYDQLRQRKQQEVQQSARSIIAMLQGDDVTEHQQTTLDGISSRGQVRTDRAAAGWTNMDSVFYRGS